MRQTWPAVLKWPRPSASAAPVPAHFLAPPPNLTPWRDDPLTREFRRKGNPVDSGHFHFPGGAPALQCRSLLIQLR